MNTRSDEAGIDSLEGTDDTAILQSIAGHMNGFMYRCMADEHFTMHYLTESVSRVLGYNARDFFEPCAVTFVSLVSPDDAKVVREVFSQCIEERRSWEVEYRLKHKGGHWIWVHEQGAPVFGERGELRYLEGAITNAERRRAAARRDQGRNARLATFSRKALSDVDDLLRLLRKLESIEFGARVESARLGDLGRGIAGVADQIGSLASEARLHARKIDGHLLGIRAIDRDLSEGS